MKSAARFGFCGLLVLAAVRSVPPARARTTAAARARTLWFRRWSESLRKAESDAFEDALQLLKHAVQECSELGDAWYYRSLVEQRLGHDALAKYAMDKARFNGSEALEQGLNPLVLATPAARGIAWKKRTRRRRPLPRLRVDPGPSQQKWALVVGIGRFTDSKIPRLNYTTADANAFAAELTDPNDRAISRKPRACADR